MNQNYPLPFNAGRGFFNPENYMPTYQYRCPECHYEFEEFQNISEEPIRVCPKCKGETRRLISGGAGFVFKGSGFYITDYRSKSYREGKSREQNQSISATSSSSSYAKSKSEKGSSNNSKSD